MSTVTITITLEVPDGTGISLGTNGTEADSAAEPSALSADVAGSLDRFVPSRYREFATRYVTRCVEELDCSLEMPTGGRQNEYLNIFPPPRCRRARVAALSLSSTRTALYTGAIDLSEFRIAEETTNNGDYVHPKVAHLDSDDAVDEAIELTRRAIARFER